MMFKSILVMGVSGSGKTTVGMSLADRLGWDFYDGDNFHTAENIAKMRQGIPLTDEDRLPWLEALGKLISANIEEFKPSVLACSALKKQYREILLRGRQDVLVVYLKGSYELIWSRMRERTDHYMKAEMLKSQFEALEEPEEGLTIEVTRSIDEIVTIILKYIEANNQDIRRYASGNR
jgi:gluconokinase